MAAAVLSTPLNDDRENREIGNGEKVAVDQTPGLTSSHDSKTERVQTEKSSASGQQGEPKAPSKLKVIWGKIGLDMGTAMMMFK
jgi:hypothetical protein